MDQQLILSHKLSYLTNNKLKTLAVRQSFTFPARKISSPGIRQAVVTDINTFLDSVFSTAQLIPETMNPRILLAKEIEALATLVEEGKLISSHTVYDEPTGPLIVIKLRQ